MVTGGTKGIGKAVADEFLELGASVLVIARDASVLETCLKEWSTRFPGRYIVKHCVIFTHLEHLGMPATSLRPQIGLHSSMPSRSESMVLFSSDIGSMGLC